MKIKSTGIVRKVDELGRIVLPIELRRTLDAAGVCYHTCELGRVDQGGGGTIAYIMALYGMQVIDSGVALLSMHAPWELSSKADVYEAYRGYKAFLLG